MGKPDTLLKENNIEIVYNEIIKDIEITGLELDPSDKELAGRLIGMFQKEIRLGKHLMILLIDYI